MPGVIEQLPHDQDVFDVIRDARAGTEQLSNRFTLAWLQWLFKIRDRAVRTAVLDEANVFTFDQFIQKVRPSLILVATGETVRTHLFQSGPQVYLTYNLTYDGANYNLDDTAAAGGMLTLSEAGGLIYSVATAGANPRTPTVAWTLNTEGLNIPGGRIVFPATQIPSADPNTLDDYEKGILWTPTLTFATPGDLAVTYSSRFGRCTKIGNRVFGQFNLITSAFTWTTSAGALTITGLPAPHLTSAGSANFGPVIFSGITKAGYTSICSVIGSGASSLTFQASGSGVALSIVVAADLPSGGGVILQGNFDYEAAT